MGEVLFKRQQCQTNKAGLDYGTEKNE